MMERDDLALARLLVRSALPMLRIQTSHGLYPYIVTDGSPLRLARASVSTNSMVCYTIAVMRGLVHPAVAAVLCTQPPGSPEEDAALRHCLDRGIRALIAEVQIRSADPDEAPPAAPGQASAAAHPTRAFDSRSRPNAGPFDSGLFGIEDPFTLTWLLELFRFAATEPDRYPKIDNALVTTQTTAIRRVDDAITDPQKPVLKPARTDENAVRHTLPLLRIVQLAKLLKMDDDQRLAQVSDWFFDRLHMQLSLKSIEHGGFDPAELVFSLEGLIETTPLRATAPILRSFLDSIDATRQLDPTLRALTPFKTTDYGSVHLFSSVEVFGSLLRIADKLRASGDHAFLDALQPTLHDYLQWLRATVVTGKAILPEPNDIDIYDPDTPQSYFGWQSQYTYTGEPSAHLWLTSQVVLSLAGYAVLLQRSIARTELARVGITAELKVNPQPAAPAVTLAEARRNDPLQLADESPYRVASRLETRFVQPRFGGSGERSYSCLLYGPPGTGKTTLARRLADSLNWPLITITTSDFVVDGEAQVEARAKKVFEALSAQREAVIFFDQIDELVLDRDTPAYERQVGMLHFMTPSMLTKINDLRHSEQVVFVVGTNYADRIDRAIKGAGGIDERMLVLPPDLSRRRQIIRESLEQLKDERSTDDAEINYASLAGYWRTITEIKSAIREAVRTGAKLRDAMTSIVPSISLETYLARLRFYSDDRRSVPPPELLEEAFMLVYLMMEGRDGEQVAGKYGALADRWATRPPGVVRDAAVEASLNVALGVR